MKTRLLAVLSVSLLVLASAATMAYAQDAPAAKDEAAKGGNVQYVDCSQVVSTVQGQYGNATDIGNRAVVAIANEQGITINQVNACLGDVDRNDDGDRDDKNRGEDDDRNTKDDKEDRDDVMADTIPEGTLPDTGGPSLLAFGAGLALVAGGASLIGGASLTRFRR